MVRLTLYMKQMAARGNARVQQGTLVTTSTVRPDADVDHVRRIRSGVELRKYPVVLCLACFETLRTDLPVTAYERCRDAECGENRTTCEMCGTRPAPYEPEQLSRGQSWRRYGR